MDRRLLTIIVCTYNRSSLLKDAISSLVEQSINKDKYCLIVVDNNSTDSTNEVVQSFSGRINISYFFEKKQGLSAARNRGIQEAKTAFVGFLDDDAKASSDWIAKAIEIIDSKNGDVFGGPIYPFFISKKPYWFLEKYEHRKIKSTNGRLKKDQFLSGSNMFFKKEKIFKVGYFSEKFGMIGGEIGMGEETDLQKKIKDQGVGIYYFTELIVYHLVPSTKMNISYMTTRSIKSSIASYKILSNSFFLNIVYAVGSLFFISFSPLLIVFRNRGIYKFWQNYYIEKILSKIKRIIWLLLDVKKIIMKVV